MSVSEVAAGLFLFGVICVGLLVLVGAAAVLSLLARDPDVARQIDDLVEKVL